MSKTAILSVRMIGDASNLKAAFKSATGGLDQWEGRTKKAATAMSVASAGVLAFAGSAVKSASDLEQSIGAVDSVFKGSADQMHQWAQSAAESVGLSRNQYNEFATVIGSQLKNLGIPMDQVGGKTNDLIGLGADLASMYGGTTADAVSALSAVFRGETDPIEKYGVSIKQSDVNARMAADGLDNLEGAAKRQAEAETRLKLVTEQTADAHGNFAREADTVAHKQQVATAQFEDAKAAIGQGLLPIVAAAAEKFGVFAQKLGENPQLVIAAGAAILGLTGALWTAWAAMKTWQTVSAITTGVKAAWGAMSKKMIADNVAVEASSKGSALRSALAWIANALRAAGAWVVMQVRAIAAFIATAVSAGVNALATAAAWVGAGLRAAGAWVVMQVRAIAAFIGTAAAATANATATAATWLAAGLRSAGAWVAMQVRAVASFGLIALQAAASAAATAAAWVGGMIRSAAAFVMLHGPMLAMRAGTLAMAAAQGVLNAVMAMNPIMLVVIAIAALVAALVLAYNKSETFRSIVQALGSIGASVFNAIRGFVMNVVNAIANLIARAGGIGGIFRSAMSAASTAVSSLTAPLRGLISMISSVISWIGRIRFPSPPAWMSRLFAAPAADLQGIMPPSSVFRFMAEPPGLTAAAAPTLASLPSLSANGAQPMMNVTVDNSTHVTVDGSGIVDARKVAESIRAALRDDDRRRGRGTAGGGF